MNPGQAHQNLKNVLLNGRILLNGMPLTANEISGLLQGEQMLFEKASKLDKALTSDKEPIVKPPQGENPKKGK